MDINIMVVGTSNKLSVMLEVRIFFEEEGAGRTRIIKMCQAWYIIRSLDFEHIEKCTSYIRPETLSVHAGTRDVY